MKKSARLIIDIDEAGEEYKAEAEELLAHPFLLSFNQSRRMSMSIDLDFFGRTEVVARRKTDRAFVVDCRRRGGLLGLGVAKVIQNPSQKFKISDP